MPPQSELFARAAECSHRITSTSDPARKKTLKQLRDMWIALANESANMSRRELDREVECIEAIQAAIDPRHQFGQYASGGG